MAFQDILVTDSLKTWLDQYNTLKNSVMNDGIYAPLASPSFTGTVTGVTKAMVGLGNADNTSDANKPISTATQTALTAKAPLASPSFTGTVTGISKAMVGLGNADNTSDANKPISTAQAAINAKKVDGEIVLGGAINLNTVIASGFYRIANTNPNLPVGAEYGQMIVVRGGDTVTQIAVGYITPVMYVRSGVVASGVATWTPGWSKVATTGDNTFTGNQTFTSQISLSGKYVFPIVTVNASTFNAVVGNEHVIVFWGDTTVKLPATFTIGDIVVVKVANGSATNAIDPNGSTIEGVAGTLILDNKYAIVRLQFLNSSWRFV